MTTISKKNNRFEKLYFQTKIQINPCFKLLRNSLETANWKFLKVLLCSTFVLLICFILACSTINNNENEYILTKYENTNNEFCYVGCVLQDKTTLDTICKLINLIIDSDINYHIFANNLYEFKRQYNSDYDPPLHELLLNKFDILKDTLIFNKYYSFGNYRGILESKFEKDKLTIFKIDSIIEFNLIDFKEIKRYKR